MVWFRAILPKEQFYGYGFTIKKGFKLNEKTNNIEIRSIQSQTDYLL